MKYHVYLTDALGVHDLDSYFSKHDLLEDVKRHSLDAARIAHAENIYIYEWTGSRDTEKKVCSFSFATPTDQRHWHNY